MNARTLSCSALTTVALVIGTALALAVANAQAQNLDPNEVRRVENIGVASGMVIGAVVGGPPGAIITGAFGGWISAKVLAGRHNKLLQTQVAINHQEILALQEANAELQAQLIASQSQSSTNLLATTSDALPTANCCGDSELVLHFRSGSSVVEALYASELKDFVEYAQSVPDAVVEIYGYADRRGEDTDNLWLSQERVQAVEHALRDRGLKDFTYETTALGEGEPATVADALETNFFDRRVILRVRNGQNEYVSSSR